MAYVNQTQTNTAGFAARITAFFDSLSERRAKYRLYRRTLEELEALPTRELNDLGLSSTNLRSVAYESVYGA